MRPAINTFSFTLDLPPGYQASDALRFQARDKEQLSERVGESQMSKGLLLEGLPAAMTIVFDSNFRQAACKVEVDGVPTAAMEEQARQIVSRMLGLVLDPADFAAMTADDPLFGPLVARQSGLRVIQSPSVFEALTWAIMGQQINVAFAVSLRRTFIEQGGRRHSSGLYCYPSAADAAAIPLENLTARQFSRSKAETLLRLSSAVASGQLDLEVSPANPIEKISAALLALKGIGPWTVNYALLRGYAHADCSLHGDVAIRAAMQKLVGSETRPDMATAEKILLQYSPHRTMAAAHLWASLA